MDNKSGRSTYTLELAEKICLEIATSSDGLETICKRNPDFPCYKTVYTWISKNIDFMKLYTLAKECQTYVLMEKTLDIVNERSNDTIVRVNRDKLIIDTYKFNAIRLNNRHFGDKKSVSATLEDVTSKIEAIKKEYERDY